MTITCKCGKELKRITATHLRSKAHKRAIGEGNQMLEIFQEYANCLNRTKSQLKELFNIEGATLSSLVMKSAEHYFPRASEEDVRKLFIPFKDIIDSLDVNVSTRSAMYSKIRALIPDERLQKEALERMRIDREDFERLQKRQQQKLKEKHQNVKVIEKQKIYHILNELKQSVNPYDNALLVQLNTGVRNHETISATFEEDKENEDKVYISNLSKNSSENSVSEVSNYTLNITPKEVVKITKSLPREPRTVFNQNCNKRMRFWFGNEYTSHDCRRFYAYLSHEEYGGRTSLNLWINKVLGHSTNGLDTSLYYSDLKIVDEPNWKPEPEDDLPIGYVNVKNRQGKNITFPINPKLRDKKTYQRLTEAIQHAHDNDVEVNTHLLRNILGYSAKLITQYKTSQ